MAEIRCVCAFDCAVRASYLIEYHPGFGPLGRFAACEQHAAEARSKDPQGYTVSIRSLNRPPVVLHG